MTPHTKIGAAAMPLVKCPDCENTVSDAAPTCPHCGRPLAAPASIDSGSYTSTPLLLGLAGSAVLFLGAFAPIVSLPFVGDQNFFQNGRGDGVIVAVLAALSLVIALARKYKLLWLTGLSAFAVLVFTFANFQTRLSEAKAEMERELSGNPFAGLGEAAFQSVQLQWGWAVLVVGAALICGAAYVGSKEAS